MTVSRQTIANRLKSVVALQVRALGSPIAVTYEHNRFVARQGVAVLAAGRFEVVAAYLDGFMRAWRIGLAWRGIAEVQAGATHECDEWRDSTPDRRCALCGREP